jgi:hypothetical protein
MFPVTINLESRTESREGGQQIRELQPQSREEIQMVIWKNFTINVASKLHLQLRIKEINQYLKVIKDLI